MIQWRLKSGADRRFRAGHPWVFSNELQSSPKGIEPGEPVILSDAGGKFLASGFGNPGSLIAFRAVSRHSPDERADSPAFLEKRLNRAESLRNSLGFAGISARLFYGEADGFPGLIIDRFVRQVENLNESSVVYVLQAHTAGADRVLPVVADLLMERSEGKASVVVRNDLSVRKLEGLLVEEPVILRGEMTEKALSNSRIRVRSASGGDSLIFTVDLWKGQKTGFFFDQFANIELVLQKFAPLLSGLKKIRVLDLFCYAGQWGAQIAQFARAQGVEVEVTAVDASQAALRLAQSNIEAQGAKCQTVELDILKNLGELDVESFDWVICDPPALIKNRKSIPAGTHEYVQLNTEALLRLKSGGAFISCSCSGLLEEGEFWLALSKASRRAQSPLVGTGRGMPSPDHPTLLEFPEGRYLKAWLGMKRKEEESKDEH